MSNLNFKSKNTNQSTCNIPSKYGKKAILEKIKRDTTNVFVIKNGDYLSKSYLKKKVKKMIEEDFTNENYELRFASFNTNDQIFSDPLPIRRKGKKFTLGPNFNNYLINGILECSANTVFESVYILFEDNVDRPCNGGGVKNYSKCIVL